MMKLTSSQRKTFFASVRQAARELGEDAEAYRRRVLKEELGVGHIADVSRGFDFDRIMSRVCQDCGDYDRAIKYISGGVERLRHLIVATAEKIVAASPEWRGSALDYVAGVMRQSGMIPKTTPRIWCEKLTGHSGWLEFSEAQLRSLLVMLAIEVRRKEAKSECA